MSAWLIGWICLCLGFCAGYVLGSLMTLGEAKRILKERRRDLP